MSGENKVVQLESITATSFKTSFHGFGFVFAAAMCLVFSILVEIASSQVRGSESELLNIASAIFAFASIISALIGGSRKDRFFLAEYEGGNLGVPCKWFRKSRIEGLQKAISLEKDELQKCST